MPIVTIGGLPVFQARVTDEETGMLRISLVDDPAVQSNFQAFDAARRIQLYAVSDEEKRLVLGVVMRADFPIYRRDSWGEYYVIYHADEIRRMAEKYLLEGRQNNVNLMHVEGTDTEGVQMVQYFLKDTAKGVNPINFDVADGSLLAEYHVVNDEVWAAIKDGTYKGFSLEGYFDLVPEEDVEGVRQIVKDLDGNFSNQSPKDNNMAKLQKIRAGLARLLAQLGNVTTDKGILAWDGDEDLKAGDRVYIEDQDGNRTDAADGDYRTEDGKTIVVVNSQVAEIRDPEAEVAPQPEEAPAAEEAARVEYGRVVTEDGDLLYEGEEDLAAGTPVFVETEDGVAPAPDGEYRTADGKVIRVVDGVVAEIIDPEAEVAPVDDRDEQIEALRRENAELRAQLEELQRTPAAQPAREVVKSASAEIRQTGVKGLDRLAAIMAKN